MPKLSSATAEDWDEWHRVAKKAHPFRYWLAEEGLDKIQDFVTWPVRKLYDVKYYINNRWVTRSHQLTASRKDIKPGDWCDVGYRFLPCLFNELVDFVEIELAWKNIVWDKEARKKYNVPFYAFGWFRWRTWRCPEAGVEYLRWETTLTNEEWLPDDQKHLAQPTPQATSAQEILELYTWWKYVYPRRPDPHDASGWTEFCERRRKKAEEQNPDAHPIYFLRMDGDDAKDSDAILEECNAIEKEYRDEDTDMLIRLIKIRDHLWT